MLFFRSFVICHERATVWLFHVGANQYYCVSHLSSRRSDCGLTLQVYCLKDKPNMRAVAKGDTPEVDGRTSVYTYQPRHQVILVYQQYIPAAGFSNGASTEGVPSSAARICWLCWSCAPFLADTLWQAGTWVCRLWSQRMRGSKLTHRRFIQCKKHTPMHILKHNKSFLPLVCVCFLFSSLFLSLPLPPPPFLSISLACALFFLAPFSSPLISRFVPL